MIRTLEAIIDEDGEVEVLEEVHLPGRRRALVTILEEPVSASETAVVSEPALAVDWERPEEEEAWASLQPAASS